MKHILRPVYVFAAIVILASTGVQAESGEKIVIALATDDFELAETDISALAIGEAQTIETENGRIIDILRTADGAEIYLDGELIEMDLSDENLHEDHMMNTHVEVTCDDDSECHKTVIMLNGDGEIDIEKTIEEHIDGDGHKVIVIKKEQVTKD